MNRICKLLLVTVLGSLAAAVQAYTSMQVGVDSNLLIDDGRVIFIQSDGSLTALSLATGQVLKRNQQLDGGGTLQRIPQGILLLNYGFIALLDPKNLEVKWRTTSHYDPSVTSNQLVSYDGYGTVECRNLQDGQVRWTYTLTGALQVIATDSHVLVHRASTYEPKVETTTVLLDAQNGQELFRKAALPGIHRETAYFDGHNIYLTEGPYKKKRSDCEPEILSVWDLSGAEVRTIPIDQHQQGSIYSDTRLELEQKTFYRGRVYSDPIPNQQFGKPMLVDHGTNEVHETAYDWGDGFVFVNHDRGETTPCMIEVKSPAGSWSATLPYLGPYGYIVAATRAQDRVILGSSLGQVECADAATGAARWLYVFPTIQRTMSYSTYGMPPMYSQAAATFREENQKLPTTGLQLTGKPLQPTVIIRDPEPMDPYADLPKLLTIAWAGALIPLVVLLLIHLHPRTRVMELGSVCTLLLLLAFICYLFYGRVSPGSSIALRLAMLASIGFCVGNGVRGFRRKKIKLNAVWLGIALGIALIIWPMFFRL